MRGIHELAAAVARAGGVGSPDAELRDHIERAVVDRVRAGKAEAEALRVAMAEVAAFDTRVYVGAAGLLLVVALVAAWLPSKRAAGLDPMTALRQE